MLNWKTQFEVVIEKMKTVVVKIKRTMINTQLIYLIFNVYMMKSVYFGCRIVEINTK